MPTPAPTPPGGNPDEEFESLPLAATETVRVRFRDIGPLPPMDLEDEVETMPAPTPTVELHPAHVWTCEKCGRDNFCRGIVAELNREESDEMIESDIDPESAVTGKWMIAPETVTCGHCGAEFKTEEQE